MSDPTIPPEPPRCLDGIPGCRDETKPRATCLGDLLCKYPDGGDGTAQCGGPNCPAVNPPDEG